MVLMATAVLALTAAAGVAAPPSSSYSGDEALTQLAASYNVSEADILDLRDKGWSWNELGSALAVTKRSGRPLQDIVNDRDNGMSWSGISEKYGFAYQAVSSNARRAAKQARQADARRRQEQPPMENSAPPEGNAPGVPPGMQQQPPPAP